MKPIFTMISESLPPKDKLLAVLCFGFEVKAATFDGFDFYDKETGSQLAVGSVKAWRDVSNCSDSDLPIVFGNIQVYVGVLKSLSDSLGVAK